MADNLDHVIAQLTRMHTSPPSTMPLMQAAAQAANITNAQFRSSGVPYQVRVSATARGARLTMNPTGPPLRQYAIRPVDVLRRNVRGALPVARNQLAARLR
jgi:hypothetical protein